jgi:hypothetical protein
VNVGCLLLVAADVVGNGTLASSGTLETFGT